ncbi:hypothetical protein E3P77_00412 [Wallemia ichthyophaga]|uniref:Uncharacterized protein n=1 Tax=Wallemia ichthyophaga TaxID=245174 RepID=A0A4T0L7W6_WALIC|nr:hypothetical protein E3P91_00515 [Wallemia ichthyophaga]TIA84100.1 hypothetical protein E3P98_00383 [Wallemia ichthyophaga]TIA93448.1 hypothetical protein E3P97_00931 [Wallemia ichthyophaga]TIB16381.1 hypothetical protein E3P90_00527 [Wallemia ichthyophaga]TIB18044.1 hypothetical protein E3P93_00384 [Wallemia ichthyophaga]
MLRIGVVAMIVYYGLQLTWSHLYKQRLESELQERVNELNGKVDDKLNAMSQPSQPSGVANASKSWLKSWIG